MVWVIKTVKILAFVILVVTFLPISFCVDLIVGDKMVKLRYFSRISSLYLRAALMVLGVKVRLRNINKLVRGKENYLVISNHLSYLDIFVIFSTVPWCSSPTPSSRIHSFGAIIKYWGVFVEGWNRSRLLQDMQHIKNILIWVLTSSSSRRGRSDDREVKPSKPPFSMRSGSGVDVLPLCVRYRKINGEDIDARNGRLVYFYDDITFYEHFFRLLNLRSISVDLTELEVIPPGYTRKESAKIAFERISGAYKGI
jgi:1-acyl-sn-glycerol-3-phosphate acyltransferase